MMPRRNRDNPDLYRKLAVGLGWFSVGLGLAQLLTPRSLSRLIGIRADPNLMRLLGARELATGIGILTRRQPTPWVHARVAGDALDLALLGTAMRCRRNNMGRAAAAIGAVAGVTALDVVCGLQLSKQNAPAPIRMSRSITINRSPEELYQRWRKLEDLPDYMSYLESVFETSTTTSHWIAKAPMGMKIEWDAELVEDRPNELIAWRSLPGATLANSGSVTFEPATGGRGTMLQVKMEYIPPAGHLGAVAAGLFGKAPQMQIATDLLHFKQKIETGEIARTKGQPAGRTRSTSRLFDDPVHA